MTQIEQVADRLAAYVNGFVENPESLIVDLSDLWAWTTNNSLYSWYSLPDDVAYKSLPAWRGKFGKDTVCFACPGMALFIEWIYPKINNAEQRDYYKGLFYKGYIEGLNDFEHQYNMRCGDDLAPILENKRCILFGYYSEIRAKYKNCKGFSADVIEKMGYNSALMLSAAYKLRLMDKALTAIGASQTIVTAPTGVQKPAHFSVNKSYVEIQHVLTALQERGFVSYGTTIETFYYRMTGNCAPTSNKIEWVKKGKKRKKDISKSSLVYFLKTFANYNVDQTLDCRNRIDEIFGISLPTSTITRISNCEYKTEIDDIVSIRREIVEI
mgnify:CR=1 FL=1